MTDELLELERGFWQAAGNGDYYAEHMAANGLCVLPVGVLDKDATVATVSDAEPWDEFEFSNVKVVDLGDDEVALCYRTEASRDGNKYVALISTVYTRFFGEWKLTLHQQTPIET